MIHKISSPTLLLISILLLIPVELYSQQNISIQLDNFFIWRDTQVIEATGLENTFLFSSNLNINHSNKINESFSLMIDLEIKLTQNYSYKARYKKFFDLYGFRMGICRLTLHFDYLEVKFGNIYSPDNDLPGEQFIPPLARSVPDYSSFTPIDEDKIYYNILSSKPRDIPIIYDSAPFNLHDTGIMLSLYYYNLSLYIYLLNGEEGLDSNSNKYYCSAIEYKSDLLLFNLFLGIGKIGSVPFKSYANKLKLNVKFYFRDIIINSMFSIFHMGLTHNKLNIYNHDIIHNLGFDGLPFEPYDIPNLYNAGEPLLGYGFYIQFKYNNDFFILRMNFSLMDTDYRYSIEEIYQVKWRLFGDIGLKFANETLKVKIGASYTYNPVFLLGDQLYHFWESIYIAPVENRLNYYTLFIILEYDFIVI